MQNGWFLAALTAIGVSFAPSLADAAPSTEAAPDVETSNGRVQSIGARYRYVAIPKGIVNLFADGGGTIDGSHFGLEYATGSESFEVVFAAMYGGYSMDPAFIKAKGEIIEGWELAKIDLSALHFTSSFLWSSAFTQSEPRVRFLYGAEVGLGFFFGDIIHTQAMPADPNSKLDPMQTPWVPCPAVGAHPYCGDENEHFGNYSEPSWFNGGAKPVFLPWLSFNTGLLFRPSPKFSARIDAGYNLFNGPFIGAAGHFGI